jgi:NAD(P)H-dependent flavin oxidoreductase YrpB (nitropropane dioxygenase family)
MGRKDPRLVHEDLNWIDDHVNGKPYGIDILQPQNIQETDPAKFHPDDPAVRLQVDFVRRVLDEAGVPRVSQDIQQQDARDNLDSLTYTSEEGQRMVDIALEHPIKLIVNALGTPPNSLIERAHAKGVKIAALAGTTEHAIRHKQAGCDFVIAVGTEAGGHTGHITSMVLWPQIVDAVAPLPVLGGGGVGRGRQLAAALALGCEGVWCGSIWLKTVQSEVTPAVKARIFAAQSRDAVVTKAFTGKNGRVLRSRYTDAWEQKDAPPLLKAPLPRYLWETEARPRIERGGAEDFLVYPVGQIVGDMREETSVRNVISEMLTEFIESKERIDGFLT